MNLIRRRFLVGLGLLPAAMAAPVASATSTATAAPSSVARLKRIRTGRHDKFDRIVLDMRGPVPTQIFRTWGPTLRQPGSGRLFWLYGCRFLTVRVEPATAHNAEGKPTFSGRRRFRTPKLKKILAVGVVGDFEGGVEIGIGARRRKKVRVFTLTSPTRVVIDVLD